MDWHKYNRLVLIVIFLAHSTFAANILVLTQLQSLSHQYVFRSVSEELARRGHHLVVLTPFLAKYTDPTFANITEVDLSALVTPSLTHQRFTDDYLIKAVFEVTMGEVEMQANSPEVRRAIFDVERRYDLVFYDASSPYNAAFVELLSIPGVAMVTYCGFLHTWRMTGNPTHPVLYGDTIILDDGELSFQQRIVNVVKYLTYELRFENYATKYEIVMKKIFDSDITGVTRPSKFADMLFVNMFPILAGNRPVTPSTIMLGGLHIKPRNPLPIHLQKYTDNAKNGVIYFSLGTFVMSKSLSLSKKTLLLDVFRQLPYNVLWKFEDDSLENVPSNVLMSKFFPQWDIFGHPNMKLFVTHGGLQSLEESILSGIPMVVMPFIWDQGRNSKIIAKHQIGIILDFETLTKDTLISAIFEVIKEKSYKENVVKLSKLIDDQPMKSPEKAAWWIEYVLRHKGAKHLRPRVVDLPLYQYFMLDVISFFLILAVVIVFIFYKILKTISGVFKRTEKFKKHQ